LQLTLSQQIGAKELLLASAMKTNASVVQLIIEDAGAIENIASEKTASGSTEAHTVGGATMGGVIAVIGISRELVLKKDSIGTHGEHGELAAALVVVADGRVTDRPVRVRIQEIATRSHVQSIACLPGTIGEAVPQHAVQDRGHEPSQSLPMQHMAVQHVLQILRRKTVQPSLAL